MEESVREVAGICTELVGSSSLATLRWNGAALRSPSPWEAVEGGHPQAEALLGRKLDQRSLKAWLDQAIVKYYMLGAGVPLAGPREGVLLRNYTLQQIWCKRHLLGGEGSKDVGKG